MSALVTAADAALPAGAVFARGGEVLTNSVAVATAFGKQHGHVLRDIEALLATTPKLEALNWFRSSTYRDVKGQDRPAFDLTRDGLVLLVMGYNGQKAVKFKLAFIEAFNRMEAELRARPAMDLRAALNDLPTLHALLLESTGQVMALQSNLAELTPKAAALDRIATASAGSLSITAAAKSLQRGRDELKGFLLRERWVYRPGGDGRLLPYQNRITQGLLETKVTTVRTEDGRERVCPQTLVTPKGLAKLAELLGAGERAGGVAA